MWEPEDRPGSKNRPYPLPVEEPALSTCREASTVIPIRRYVASSSIREQTMPVLVSSAGKVAGTSVTKAGPLAGGLLAGSAAGFVFQVFLRQRDVLLALAVLLVLASVAGVPLARRARRPLPLVLLGLWAVAVIPAFTLVPDFGFSEYGRALWEPSRIALELGGGWSSALLAWAHGTDGPLNVVLFLPAGLFLAVAMRRPARTVLGLGLLSLSIEVIQAWSGTRSGSPGDCGANVLGAAVGAAAAGLIMRRTDPRRPLR